MGCGCSSKNVPIIWRILSPFQKFLKAVGGGNVSPETAKHRLEVCRACTAKDSSGQRLYRVIKGKPYCGKPLVRSLIKKALRLKAPIREEHIDGCGCMLTDKVNFKNATCPLGKWLEGDAHRIEIIREEPKILQNTYDIFSESEDGTDCTGIGDALAALPAVHALARKHPDKKIRFVTHPASVAWAKLGWKYVVGKPKDGLKEHGEKSFYINKKRYIFEDVERLNEGINRQESYERAIDANLTPISLQTSGDALQWAKEEIASALAEGKKIAVIAHESNSIVRSWPLRHWITLSRMLQANGYAVFSLERPAGKEEDNDIRKLLSSKRYPGLDPARTTALLEYANVYIGNDSGMSHLAGLLGIPSVVMCGASDGRTVYGWYPTINTLNSELPCTACYVTKERGHQHECLLGCDALYRIFPEQVLQSVQHICEDEQPFIFNIEEFKKGA